jgi:hypothetical protein
MTTLLSKIQHNTFEIGEFVEEKERSYEETIDLIECFPWEKERKNLAVSLTNPSVTIQSKNKDFLKLALFYNGMFVLHYFNGQEVLFTKSFTNIKDTYSYIKNFFEQEQFEAAGFKKENTWMQHNLKHFISQDFRYTVTKQSVKNFLISTSGFNFVATLFLIGLFIFKPNAHTEFPVIIFMLVFMFLVGGGINLIIFFNFYGHVKNKILIMSKGNDVFYYGEIGDPVKYNKSQIIEYRSIMVRNSRNPISGFALIIIELKDGNELMIPNLLVDYLALEQKLSGIPRIDENRTPFIR